MPEEIGWIVTDGAGATSLVERHGRVRPCELRDALPAAGEVESTLVVDGESRAVRLVAVPLGGTALAIPQAGAGDGLAAALEILVNQIAHDIRNFAFTVGLQAEMGLRGTPTPDGRRHMEAVLRQVDGLRRYLDELLLFGRPVRLEPQAFDPEGFLREEIQRFQFSWDSSGSPASVRLVVAGLPPTVTWDRRSVATVLAALLDNAARSAAPPPPITITAGPAPGGVALVVRDEGPGMSPETVAALATPMKVRRAGAAGLGLAIARKLVRAQGGSFDLLSEPGGTTVTVFLPFEVDAD